MLIALLILWLLAGLLAARFCGLNRLEDNE